MKILRSRKGQGTVEYILIAVFVVLAAAYVKTKLLPAVKSQIDTVSVSVTN